MFITPGAFIWSRWKRSTARPDALSGNISALLEKSASLCVEVWIAIE
jgi:hypothetical protein